MSNVLQWNHVRSEEEAYVVREIGTDLNRSFDNGKPVVFVGSYTLSPYVTEGVSVKEDDPGWHLYQDACEGVFGWIGMDAEAFTSSRKYVDTCVKSMLTWGTSAFNQEAMLRFFQYYNYDYVWVDNVDMILEAREYAEGTGMPGYPRDGYIEDLGEYIVVNLG